jgi:hypothetical protein
MDFVVRLLIGIVGGVLCLLMTCAVIAAGSVWSLPCVAFACTVGVLVGVLGGRSGRGFAIETSRAPMKSLRATGRGVKRVWEIWYTMISSD